jgi:hypothetical protein
MNSYLADCGAKVKGRVPRKDSQDLDMKSPRCQGETRGQSKEARMRISQCHFFYT